MDYSYLIKNWHNKASNEDYFSKFTFEFLAFIAHLRCCLYLDVSTDKDRKAIQKLKLDLEIKRKYLDRINNKSSLKQDWEEIRRELNREPLKNISSSRTKKQWWNCSQTEVNQQTEKEKLKTEGNIHSLDDWENMVEFWYIIRNNLFHGPKDPERKRDQFMAEYGYKTLKELIEILLHDSI